MFESVTKNSQSTRISKITISVTTLTGIVISIVGKYNFWKSAAITGAFAGGGVLIAGLINTIAGKE